MWHCELQIRYVLLHYSGCIQEYHTGIGYNVLYDYHNKHSLCHWATAYKDVSSDINANGYHYYSLK